MDEPLRDLERRALSGNDPEAQRLYLAALRRSIAPLTSDDLIKLQRLIKADLDTREFALCINTLGGGTTLINLYIDKGKTLLDYLHEHLGGSSWTNTLPNWVEYRNADPDTRQCYFYKQNNAPIRHGYEYGCELVDGHGILEPKSQYVVRTAPYSNGNICNCSVHTLLIMGCQCEGD